MRYFILAALLWFSTTSAYADQQFKFAFGDDLSVEMRELVEETASKAADYFRKELGAELPKGTLVVASGEPRFVARQYMRHQGIPGGLSRWTQTWSKERSAEGAWRGIFIRTSAESFNTDYGGGIDAQRMRVIAHELFHVLQYELVGPRARNCCEPNSRIPIVGPIWMMEGAAQYVMLHFEHYATGRTLAGTMNWVAQQRWAFKGTLADLETRDQMSQHENGYWVGMMAAYRLSQKNGISSLADYWRAIGDGQSWQKALETAFGWSKEDTYRRL